MVEVKVSRLPEVYEILHGVEDGLIPVHQAMTWMSQHFIECAEAAIGPKLSKDQIETRLLAVAKAHEGEETAKIISFMADDLATGMMEAKCLESR